MLRVYNQDSRRNSQADDRAKLMNRTISSTPEHKKLCAFVAESNRIEGIDRVLDHEIAAHIAFLSLLSYVTLEDLEIFVDKIASVPLRRSLGQDVRVAGHVPPPGGPAIETDTKTLLAEINAYELTPYEAHIRYETLHPFLDGNGRSGRALWAWQMLREGKDPFALPFLHCFYYQALDGARRIPA
jgi:hypothetical protein